MKRPKHLSRINVPQNVMQFMDGKTTGKNKGRHPRERFASFDYCFNYFQSFREQNRIGDLSCPENMQQSCLQIGFYLASWGMLRGSSFLLGKSVRFYKPLVETIAQLDSKLWEVDVDSYSDENVALLIDAKNAIRNALGMEELASASDTLVSKIMLGIFGNVPAFDKYVCRGLDVWRFNKRNLQQVREFYDCHQQEIDRYARTIHTLDFHSGEETGWCYTRAKIVDMVGFIEGQRPD